MNRTARHIVHLLAHTLSVEVCGIGVFGRVWVSAGYNAVTGEITAPREGVGFEYLPGVATSASLIGSLCRQTGMDEDAARDAVAADVRDILGSLAAEGSYDLAALGTLRHLPSGEIAFECSADYVGETGACRLPAVTLRPLDEPASAPAEKAAAALRESQRRAVAGRGIRIAATWGTAVAVFAAIVLVTGWINRLNGDSHATMASTLPATVHTGAAAVPAEPDAPLLLVFRTPADGIDEARVRPERPVEAPQVTADGPYCLIVASLATMDEARTFVARHSTDRLPLSIVPVQGRIRISALSGTDAAALASAARTAGVYDLYPNAWVCRR